MNNLINTATINQSTGRYYIGTILNKEPHGRGTFYDKDNRILYEGWWKNGKQHGIGTSYCAKDKKFYEGEWCEGEIHGWGTIYFNNELFYEGEWHNGECRYPEITFDSEGKPYCNLVWVNYKYLVYYFVRNIEPEI